MTVDKRELLDRADELEHTLEVAQAQLSDLRTAIANAKLPDAIDRPTFRCNTCTGGLLFTSEEKLLDHQVNVHGLEAAA